MKKRKLPVKLHLLVCPVVVRMRAVSLAFRAGAGRGQPGLADSSCVSPITYIYFTPSTGHRIETVLLSLLCRVGRKMKAMLPRSTSYVILNP
jgi:hypothetical protein